MIFEGKSSSSSTSRPSETLANANYAALRSMREKYRDDGFEILAIPVNQSGVKRRDVGDGSVDVRRKFGVDDLEVFDKVGAKAKPVKCKGIDEVAYEAEFKDDPDAIAFRAARRRTGRSSARAFPYEFLKRPPFDGELPWNYTKFLVDRNGHVVRRYAPGDPLEQGFESDLRKTLAGEPLASGPTAKLSRND